MSLRCLIIDDEPLAHDIILTYLEDIPFIEVAGQFYRATEALDFLSKNEIDLIFLDIRMPKLNGLDFIRTLTHKPIIIITSAYEEYALESFDLDVCDYLHKPFRFDRLLKAANRALEIHNLKKQASKGNAPQQTLAPESAQIAIKADKKTVLMPLDEIQYLESLGNYVKVWRDNDFLLTPRTMSSFEEQLPASTFVRIHKSYILNKKFVHYMEGNTIYLKNKRELPIGKNFRPIIKQLLDMEE
ncbi:LytTR family DNA-binding domain-containing protein [Pedobacter sp. KR3-3]|uniref:LytTR family DNA-binding domain-containing protein n=1 Tax=Pedobacter albus TaxID=3113905 RepID=A0ABU7I659_9SPHI|nr:LytTR family DNA-binding domain-containing protein [Pedobacter sp. KR3-3]MEE1944739.1 LytTR family DNA-binding domain-containing protein [Pedobacter sp. KR3-3]